MKISSIFEYLDLFGTKTNFYIEKKAKNYTVLGGIFSILSLIFSFIAFIYFNLDDFKRIDPTTTVSSFDSEIIGKINFRKEKIYIPWRITDGKNKLINHTSLIFPDIEYIQGEKKNLNDGSFEYSIKKLNYTLCNKTSMINLPNNYYLDVPLNNLYCTDMDNLNLDIGGSWLSNFNYFFKISMYLCKNNIDYNETNPNCTNYGKLVEKIGEDNPLYIEIFYPTLQFQPLNISQPIVLSYKQYYYKFTLHTNKLDRLFLKKNILEDDLGWFNKNIKRTIYWEYSNIKEDYYSNKKNIFNKNISTSLLYTLLVYLDTDFLLYKRQFKKISLVIVEGLSIMHIVFVIFRSIAKIFKKTEEIKTIMKLLFENNLKEKKINFKKSLLNIQHRNESKMSPILHSNNHFIEQIQENKLPLTNNIFSFQKIENMFKSQKNNINSKSISGLKKSKSLGGNYLKNKGFYNSINHEKPINILLFPYKYYFFSVFIKNDSILKKESCFFSKKFIEVYKYFAKIIDITTYLKMQKEFYKFKTEILDVQKLNMIERERKMNTNDKYYLRYIGESDMINGI